MNLVITRKILNSCLIRCPEILHTSLDHKRDSGAQGRLGVGFQQFCIVKLVLYRCHPPKGVKFYVFLPCTRRKTNI